MGRPFCKALPVRRTLNKKFSAYCEVCWNAVYVLWIDDEPHGGVCPLGHTKAEKCPDAMGRAELTVSIAKARKKGLLTTPPTEE